jgi:catechol 2,3-dioxygenase-like lactoylglutathione lyase family enzyme
MTYSFDHVGLSVADLDKQESFYRVALGLEAAVERVEIPAAGIRTVILQSASGLRLELIERAGSSAQEFADAYDGASVQGLFHWALRVDDLDASFTALEAAGARVVSAPAAGVSEGVRFAYVKDPEGNLIEIIQPASTTLSAAGASR